MPQQAGRVYLLWGEDGLGRDEVVRSFKTRMLGRAAGQLNISEFRAPEVDTRELIDACNTVPFMADRRLVIIHHLFSWRARSAARHRGEGIAGVGADANNPLKVARQAYLEYLPDLAPLTTLILAEGSLSVTQRSEIVKRLPANRVDVRAFPAPRGPELERWLTKRARLYGGELGPGVAGLLREHGPSALEALDQEVKKLIAYAGREPVSVKALSELLPGAEIVVFQLLDAVAESRSADAMSTVRRLFRRGHRAEEFMPQLIALFRRLLLCRLALQAGMEPAEVERRHGVKLIDKLKRQARAWPTEQIEWAMDQLLAFDRKLKTSEIEPESGLELLLADLARLPPSRPQRRQRSASPSEAHIWRSSATTLP